jgi:hypothetical protein
MKMNPNLSIVLLWLAGAGLSSDQAIASTLTGTQNPAPAAVNLTTEGALDWAHWGLNSKSDFDHKASGGNRISDVQTVGTVEQFPDAPTGFSWSDGLPTTTVGFTASGIFIAGLRNGPNRTNGFQFTVAADATPRLLKVYAGAWNAKIHFQATLSDASALPYVDESLDDFGAGAGAVYSVRFAANGPGQTLTIRIYSVALHDPGGNCTLMSASLGTPFNGTGALSGSGSFLANLEMVDLTAEGTLDWAHWASEIDFNQKEIADHKISNITPVGSGFVSSFSGVPAIYHWTDGIPTVEFSTSSGIFVPGEGNGFEFTVAADTNTRILRVYVNGYSARILLEASLSDGSAVPLYDGSYDTTPTQQGPVRVYTIVFKAASANQTLTVRTTVLADEGSGWISLQAATLQAQPAQTGILGGGYTVLAVASTVDLTEEGKIDWAHWGLDQPTDVDRKVGGTNVLGDFGVIGVATGGGPLEVLEFDDNFTAYSWSDGIPTTSVDSSGTGIYLGQAGNFDGPGLNTGFTLSVPADTSIRALKVYVGAYGCRMHFEAALSDGSAPAFVDESFANPSDGPNRVYTLTFAAASPGQKLIVRWWIVTLIDSAGNVTLQSAVVREAAPSVSLQTPPNGSIFQRAADGLRFTASTIAPFSIAANQLGLELNGTVLSSSLVVSGTPTARTAIYTGLSANVFYEGRIWAVDNLGNAATNTVKFDTFSTNGVVVVEAEDYNYDAGHFINNPAPGAYTNLSGTFDIDLNFLSLAESDYRPADPVDIETAPETRSYFIEAGVNNYVVGGWNPGSWLNYTRTFPSGEYLVYLRYGSVPDQQLTLDLVTSNPTQAGQTLAPLGILNAPHTPNENAFVYAPLTDASENIITVALSGQQTLRLTGAEVMPAFGLRVDFLMLVPTESRPKLSIGSSVGQVVVSFPTHTGRTYALQYKNALADTIWQDIPPSIVGDGTIKSVSQPANLTSRFYRVNVQ